ncbi:hypothetical protein [Serinicoccus kebangsaanensis]|uniref:hypothetical protein n=1 Tax=Serinicoccus kebangsaanensis TaxID=2602069 RepID=UPI00124CA1FA|nr:hypothetical protein [Serinicoccus kebangsaanensis]
MNTTTTTRSTTRSASWQALILGLTCGVALALALDNWLYAATGIAFALAFGWRPVSHHHDPHR